MTPVARMLRRLPIFPLFGRGQTQLQPADVEDVAQAIARMMQTAQPRMYYELGGPRIYTNRTLLQMLARHLGRKPILVPIPFGLWRALAYVAEMLPQPPITRNQVELMQIDSVASRIRRFADFTDISAGRAPCDRGMIPQLPLVLYMRRAPRRVAPTPSMRHRSGNSPLHPAEIFHRPTVAARSSRRGQAPARDHAEPDCDRSEAQISRSPEGSRVAPIVLVASPHRFSFEDDLGRLLRLGNGVERLLCTHGCRADHQVRPDLCPPEICCHRLSRFPAALAEGPVMVIQAGIFPARFSMA